MEVINTYTDYLISLVGLEGDLVPVVRHGLLVLVAILLSALAGLVCRKVFVPLILKMTTRTEAKWDDVLFNERVLVSACQIVPAIVIWQLLPMVFSKFPVVRELLTRATAIYITVMSVRLALVFISSFKNLEGEKRTSTQQYLYSFMGVMKILMLFIAVIIVISILIDRDPVKLFAGLGATSAVLMLVFQDTIKGLVAGVRLTSNDMLHKGDWITVPKAGANGIVEEITLTTVKIRNFDNTIVTVTPQTLVDDSFQNWNGMQQGEGRRVNRKVYYDFRSIRLMDESLWEHVVERGYYKREEIRGQTVNLTLYRNYVERFLRQHKEVNAEMTLMVRQLEATQCGLPVEFYFFLKDKTWVNYEHHLAEIMEQIYALATEFGLKIYEQYPDQ